MDGGRVNSGVASHEDLFLVFHDETGECAATACVWSRNDQSWHPPGMGELGWVASRYAHRGHGLGNLVTVAVLHRLKAKGLTTARLNTDDWRVPAIKSYFNMGFRASIAGRAGSDGSDDFRHPERWAAVEQLIASGARSPNIEPGRLSQPLSPPPASRL